MTFSFLTGSESLRDTEILLNWYVFEPMTTEDFALSGGCYSAPMGQDKPADFLLQTGSISKEGDYLLFEKLRYVFDDEFGANNFIIIVGEKNVAAYYEKRLMISPGAFKTQYVVEVINHPTMNVGIDPINFEESRGYRISVFQEDGSNTFQMGRDIIEDELVGILNEPFLRYFDIEDSK